MSKITTIHDQMLAIMATEFPSKFELINPYEIQDNDHRVLNNGYGIQVDVATRNNINDRLLIIDRDINVLLTQRTYGSERDIAARKTVEKQLLEDQLTVIQAFRESPEIRAICEIYLVDDNGIEAVFDEKTNFLMINTRFTAKYEEIINVG